MFPAMTMLAKGIRAKIIDNPTPDPLVVTVADASAYVHPISPVSNTLTVSTTGGVGPFTYQWTKVSGNSGLNIIGTATEVSVEIGSSGEAAGSYADVFRCTVTDTGNADATAFDDSTVSVVWVAEDGDGGGSNTISDPNWTFSPFYREK